MLVALVVITSFNFFGITVLLEEAIVVPKKYPILLYSGFSNLSPTNGKLILTNESQPKNTSLSIYVTLFGITMLVKSLQP